MVMHAGSGIRAAMLVGMVAALAACGNRGAAPEPPRPVLVAHPAEAGAAGMAAVTAYAGEVRAREESALSFRVGGKIARRRVDAGDVVHRGDLLAELDPDDLRLQTDAAQAQLAAAEAQLARARADHARFATLAKDQLVSRSVLDQQTAALRAAEGQVRAARAQRDVASNQRGYTELRAPADGAIGQRMAEAGQVLAPGQTVFTFVADGEREVAFALPEANVADFHAGQPVLIELWNDKGPRIEGRIREISPVADPLTRTYAARATLAPGTGPALSIGQSARVYIGSVDTRLSVPLSALQRDDQGRTVVWVADPQAQRAHQVRVVVGPYAADHVPVQSGLKAGDWVVVAGGHLLYPGLPVLPVDRGNRPVAAN